MLIDKLLNTPWLAVSVWMFLYIGDCWLTVIGMRLLSMQVNRKGGFGKTYELNPLVQSVLGSAGIFKWRLIVIVLLSAGFVVIITVSIVGNRREAEFLLGAMLLVEAVIHFRHYYNLYFIRNAKRAGSTIGSIEFSRVFSLKLSSFEFFKSAIGSIMVFLATDRVFFLGGAVTLVLLSIEHRLLLLRSGQGEA